MGYLERHSVANLSIPRFGRLAARPTGLGRQLRDLRGNAVREARHSWSLPRPQARSRCPRSPHGRLAEITAQSEASLSVCHVPRREGGRYREPRWCPAHLARLRTCLYNDKTLDLASRLILINLDRIRSPTFQVKYHNFSDARNTWEPRVASPRTCPRKIQIFDPLWNIAGCGDHSHRGSTLGADLSWTRWPDPSESRPDPVASQSVP